MGTVLGERRLAAVNRESKKLDRIGGNRGIYIEALHSPKESQSVDQDFML